jgi:hypothetical protein
MPTIPALSIDERVGGPTALWVEHERNDIGTGRDIRVCNPLDDAVVHSVGSIFGPGFTEQLPRAARHYSRSLNNNLSNPNLVRQNCV